MKYAIWNVTTGAVSGIDGCDVTDFMRRLRGREFVEMMNASHQVGSAHVTEFHSGQPQTYMLVDVVSGAVVPE